MRVRFRMWWEFLPFTAKAALIVVVAWLTITVSARAATPLTSGDSAETSVPSRAHRLVVTEPGNDAAITVDLASFTPRPSRPGASRAYVQGAKATHRHAARHRAQRAGRAHDHEANELERSTRQSADSAMSSIRRVTPVDLPASPRLPGER